MKAHVYLVGTVGILLFLCGIGVGRNFDAFGQIIIGLVAGLLLFCSTARFLFLFETKP